MERIKIPFGYIEGDKIYLEVNEGSDARLIGEVKSSQEDSVRYFQDRFAQFSDKITELENNIHSAENKGSFLMKLIHLKSTIHAHDGLGDYRPLAKKLEELEVFLNDVIAKNRVKNTEIKTALLAEAEEVAQQPEWKEATDKLLEVKSKWLRTGNASDDVNEAFEERFKLILDDFFGRKKEFFEEKQKLIDNKVAQYKSIIQEVEESPALSFFQVRKFQERWKEVGKIPAVKFKELSADFSRKLKYKSAPKRTDQRTPASPDQLNKNYEEKKRLLEQLNAIDIEKEPDSINKVRALKESWKKIGMVPKELYRPQQEEFNMTADLLTEKYFLEKMAASKDPSYAQKNSREKLRIKMRLLKDLLVRDEKELQAFFDNMGHVNTRQGAVNKMLDQKLAQQKHKVQVKKALIRAFKQTLDTF